VANTLKLTALFISLYFDYLIIAGAPYLFFYVWKKKKFWRSKIQQYYPQNKHIARDIKYSFFSLIIFFIVFIVLILASYAGLTQVYQPIDKYGYTWYFASIVVMIIMHDTYFYWTHRFMHWKPILRSVHRIHHLSHNPTPFSAFAFHPVEALIEVGIVPLIAFTVPVHTSAITMFLFYQLFLNVMGHLGYEIFPKGFASHKIFKWHTTPTYHNMHHKFVKCNYGLYFNFWDRFMKTNHARYEDYFDEVAQRDPAIAVNEASVGEVGDVINNEAPKTASI